MSNEKHIFIHKNQDGNAYSIDDLNIEQTQIALTVMTKVLEWINIKQNKKKDYSFEPMHMTIVGRSGTGKSFLIKTIVNTVRKITQINDSVIICAPTGKTITFIHLVFYFLIIFHYII